MSRKVGGSCRWYCPSSRPSRQGPTRKALQLSVLMAAIRLYPTGRCMAGWVGNARDHARAVLGGISDQRFPVRPRSRSLTTAPRIVSWLRHRQEQLWMARLVPFVKASRSRCPAIASDCGRPCATSRGSRPRNSASVKPICPAATWIGRSRDASWKRRDGGIWSVAHLVTWFADVLSTEGASCARERNDRLGST